MTVVNL